MLILEEHYMPYPHCERCGQQVAPWLIKNWHFNNVACWVGQEKLC